MTRARRGEPVRARAYWRALVRRTLVLLGVWLLVGPILGILLADILNNLRPRGVPLGFWIAQQGAIYIFVILIFIYAWLSDRADRGEGGGAEAETVTHWEPRKG